MYDLGLRIKEAREKRGMSQADLARKIKRSRTAVSSYESEKQYPPLDVLCDIADALYVPLEFFAGENKRNAVNIDHCSDKQQDLIEKIVLEFCRIENHSEQDDLRRYRILTELAVLFRL